jgi:hypothetical protein
MKKSTLVALALVLVSAPLLSSARPAGAQSTAPFDHLKCYKISAKQGALIQNKPHIFDPLVLTPLQHPPFDVEDCFLLPRSNPLPREICVPVNKNPAQPPAGLDLRNDYLCYTARCTSQPDLLLGVKDQFVRGSVTVRRKASNHRVCVPAYKLIPVPPCQFDAAGTCGGTCTIPGNICTVQTVNGTQTCGCFPPPTTCGGAPNPATGQCGGTCPVPGVCRPVAGANICQCQ